MEASKRVTTKLTILTLVVLVAAISATARGNDGSGLCNMSQDELSECKPAVATGTATPPSPTTACCAALKHADIPCFCSFKNNKYLAMFGINATRAMELPSKCDPNLNAHC